MQRNSTLKRIFLNYSDSFDHYIVARQGCSPASVLLVLVVALPILLIPSLRTILGIRYATWPLSCIVAGSLFSIASWKAYPHRGWVSLFQFSDLSLYGAALVALSSVSIPQTSSLFAAIWIIAVVYWATVYGFSLMGLISVLLGPTMVLVAVNGSPLSDASFVLGAMLWIFVSRITKAKRLHQKKAIGVLSILDDAVDNAADLRRSSIVDLHNLKLISILHKAKNDLTPARWNIEFLANRAVFSDDHRQVLHETRDCIDSTLGNLYHCLDQYRSRSNDTPFYNFSDLISDIREHLAAFQQLTFSVDYPPDFADFQIHGRIDDIRLSITTLIENSKDAGADHFTLKSMLFSDDNRCRFSLSDNGSGLPLKVKERLFEPFNSFGKRTGVGLGLYLASRLVSANHGELSLVSSDDSGTVFSLDLSMYKPLHVDALPKTSIAS